MFRTGRGIEHLEVGGFARIAAIVDRCRKENPGGVLALDCGLRLRPGAAQGDRRHAGPSAQVGGRRPDDHDVLVGFLGPYVEPVLDRAWPTVSGGG
jgi:hypothetical protein